MAANWDLSSDDEATTTNNTNVATTTTTNKPKQSQQPQQQQAQKKKKRKRRKKKKTSNNNTESQTETPSTSQSPIKSKKKKDNWSDSDDEEDKKKSNNNNNNNNNKQNVSSETLKSPQASTKQPVLLLRDSSIAKSTKESKTKGKTEGMDTLDDNSNDEEDDESTTIDTKSGKYPIWRPEQNYKYEPIQYDYEPSFIQRDEILLKVKRKQTFEQIIKIFEDKHGLQSFEECKSDLLEVYGINLYNHFVPIYENIGEDNHRPFMIDFDSLLLDIFHSPLISTQLKYGARLLPIISILDNYLDLLFGGGRSVQIIMFECNHNVWKYAIHHYLREYIKYYLLFYWQLKQQNKYNISYPLVLQFESFWSDSFSNYIYQYLPVFALIARPDFSPFIMDENRYLFIYQTLYLIALKIPCVQSTEITFNSNALYGFSIDVPSNIERYILNKFRLTTSSSNAIKLKPLLNPIKPGYLNEDNLPTLNVQTITNLNFIDTISIEPKCNDKDKINIRRLSTLYALISMLDADNGKVDKSQWDFIRLVLLQLIILENEPNKHRLQMLPQIDIADRIKSNKNKNNKDNNNEKAKETEKPTTSSWVDMMSDDDDDDSMEEEEPEQTEETKEEEPEEEEEEEEEEDDTLKEYDLDKIIRECWWMKVDALSTNLQQFMMHCTTFLSQYLDEYEQILHDAAEQKTKPKDQKQQPKVNGAKTNGVDKLSATVVSKTNDLNLYGHFDHTAFKDCFDARILCYLLSVHNKRGGNGQNRNKLQRWLQNEKSIINNLGLTTDHLKQLQNLYDIVTDDVDKTEKPKLFPIIQSKELLDIKFKSEYDDYNKNMAISDEIKSGFIKIDGDIINILMGDTEKELEAKGLLYSTKRISGLKERRAFFRKHQWVRAGKIPDGINPYVYQHRSYMIFQTFIQKYAQSLEGGKVVLRDVIVGKSKKKTDDNNNNNEDKKKNYTKSQYVHSRKKGGTKKAGKGKKKIDVRIAAELEVKKKEREAKLQKVDNLIRVCTTMYKDLESRIQRLDEELQETNDPIAALPGLTKLHEWATESALKSDIEKNNYPVVRLWQITFDIFRRFIENVNVDDDDEEDENEDILPSVELVRNLQKSLHSMGFEQPARRIAEIYVDKKKGALSLSDVLIPFNRDNIRISIGTSYARFQMEHCGPYMIRGVGSRPDPRVTGFYPDEWQVKLLDIVDHRYSALVVAPTSSGKTFVSYYCMKEILQQNKSIKNARDKGIVIYVSPTKALTWQACADIYSKYGDVFGVLTPDYDHKPLECQVLVCVPESFEKLLMSPQRTQLHKQIKYVIFDEIHCLGRSEGGAIWERLLMMIRAPFLALSATVGHPLRLKKWLNTISNVLQLRTDEYKHKVKIIQHKERWSYLEKYIYLPDTKEDIKSTEKDLYIGCHEGDKGLGWKSSILNIHPVGAIGLTTNNNVLDIYDGFPPLSFSPSNCITLYDAMTKYVDQIDDTNEKNKKRSFFKNMLLKLKPDLFFKDDLYITKNQASAYEKLLKKQLKAWIVGFNRKSQIIDQDLFDIKENKEIDDDKDEKLQHIDEIELKLEEKPTKALSKKEKKKLEQQKKAAERERQRRLAEERRQQALMAKKRKKGGKHTKGKGKGKETEAKRGDDGDEEQEEKQANGADLMADLFGENGGDEEILSIAEKKVRREIVDKLLNSMASYTLSRVQRMEDTFDHGKSGQDIYSFEWVLDNFINLVIELDSSDRLPALVFCLDRVECEQLYLKLLSDLEFLETKKQQSEMGGSNNREMEIERRRRLKKLEKERKKREKAAKTAARQKKDEDENPEIHDGLDEFGDLEDDANKTDYRFTLFDRGDEMDKDEMGFWTKRLLKKTKWPLTHPLMKGLERGIGLHHEGLPIQYRHLVETLFRARMIKLVVTVASLAMGVNMPARSVVFAGDNEELDPLNYRQMMGRAGRRGYDNIGHVIFFGISPRKISYLMTSQLTSLNGHYPILSTTSSIRCTQLLTNSMADQDIDDKYYIGLIQNLFHQPFNYKTGVPLTRNAIIHKFRYSLEYHLQNGLLSTENLDIDGLGDLASMLHEYEPNNFLFIKVLQSGYLHEICKGYTKLSGDHNSKLKKDILCKLLLILCHIFELHPVPIGYKPRPSKSSKYLSKSYLILPEKNKLDQDILEMIDKYRYNFASHFYNMYNKIFNEEENEEIANIYGKENVLNYIEYYLKYYDGGVFGHNQVFLKDFRGRNLRKNSYVYDFYMHEDYKRIVDEASLRDGLAWRKLKKFQLLLLMIKKSLDHISSLKSKQDLINEEVKTKIEEFENGLQKLRQHKFSIYRNQQQFWMDNDGKLWKKYEIQQYKDNLKLQAIGDDFVMAFQDLSKDFQQKFKNIVPIGPISNYDSIQAAQPTTNGGGGGDVAGNGSPQQPPKIDTPSQPKTTTTSDAK